VRKNNSYLLSQTGSVDQTPLFFVVLTSMTIKEKREKNVSAHNWMRKAVLHCDAGSSCGWKKSAVFDI
jgi:hypothetical protein